jgi:hypothetical protein
VTHETGVKYLGLGVLILLDVIFWSAFGLLKESEKTNADLNIIKQRYHTLWLLVILLI